MSSIQVSILLKKIYITNNESFHFLPPERDGILKEIINLDNRNVSRMYQIHLQSNLSEQPRF